MPRTIDAPPAGAPDEAPASASVAPAAPVAASSAPRRTLKRGWGAAEEVAGDGNFAATLKVEIGKDPLIIAFLEPTPYVSFHRHWVSRPSSKDATQRVNLPFTCLDSFDEPCPLCDVGLESKAVTCFNVALLTAEGKDPASVSLKSLDLTPAQTRTIKKLGEGAGGLDNGYWAVTKERLATGYNQLNFTPIKNADRLTEDYPGIVAPLDADLAGLRRYDTTIVRVESTETLKEIAAESVVAPEYNNS